MIKARGVYLILLVGLFAYANPTPSPPSDATATKRGLVNTTSQTFSGLKTYVDGGIIADLRTGSTFEGNPILTGFSDGGSSFITSTTPIINGRSFETTGSLNLFVNGELGNDNNDCTDGGPFACATISGALFRTPREIQHTTIITTQGLSDGGVLDYAGFLLDPSFRFRLDSGITTTALLTIRGTLGPAILDSGTGGYGTSPIVQAAWGDWDAGGGSTDGGLVQDDFNYASFGVPDAGWTPGDLRGRFARFNRSDGGTSAFVPIFDNSSDRIFPVFQQTSTNYTGGFYENFDIVEPKTRITTARPGSTSELIRVHPVRQSLPSITISWHDIAPVGSLTINIAGGGVTFVNDRINWGPVDLINISGYGSAVSISGSVARTTGGGRYLLADSAIGTSVSFLTSLFYGTAKQLLVRAGGNGGVWSVSSSTILNLASLWTVTSVVGNDSHLNVQNNRFITMTYPIYVASYTGGPATLQAQRNVFDNVTESAITLSGSVRMFVNYSNNQVGSHTRNVGRYGIEVYNGAWGVWDNRIFGGGVGSGPTGNLGDLYIEGVGVFPGTTLQDANQYPSYPQGRNCIVNLSTGSRICSGGGN